MDASVAIKARTYLATLLNRAATAAELLRAAQGDRRFDRRIVDVLPGRQRVAGRQGPGNRQCPQTARRISKRGPR